MGCPFKFALRENSPDRRTTVLRRIARTDLATESKGRHLSVTALVLGQ